MKEYLKEEHETQTSIKTKYPSTDANEQIKKITTGHLILSDPQNVGCSKKLYQGWPTTHSGLSQPLLIPIKGIQRNSIEKATTALMNRNAGGTILVGC